MAAARKPSLVRERARRMRAALRAVQHDRPFAARLLQISAPKLNSWINASARTLWAEGITARVETFAADMHRLCEFIRRYDHDPRSPVSLTGGVSYHFHDMIGTRWASVKTGDIYFVTNVAILMGPSLWFLGDKLALIEYRQHSTVGPVGPTFARVAWHFAMRFEPVG